VRNASGAVINAANGRNQGRAVHNLPALSAATAAEAWPILQRERGAVLWLEGRRVRDLRRWLQESGPAHNPTLANRDSCVPIGRSELLTNPNL
jgi:starch-binding outer membrane protein, SusD/RagB family